MKFQAFWGLALALLLNGPLQAQTFTRITDAGNPINSRSMGGNYRGCAWVDVDADGDLDLSVAGAGAIFINDGSGNFSSRATPGQFLGTETSVSWADIDGNGTLDCLHSYNQDSKMYLNDGSGNFTTLDPDPSATLRAWSASLGDWDNDGLMDAIWSVPINYGFSTANLFYGNRGNGTFVKIDSFDFSIETADYTVAHWIDYDDDGDMDLFLASGPGGVGALPDHFYRNLLAELGYPRFIKNTQLPFFNEPQDGQCYNFVDTDLDGDRDMYLTNWASAPNRYYERDSGTFIARQNALIMGPGNAILSNGWGDLDNDGYEDVVITGGTLASAGVYKNNGNHQFQKIASPFLSAGGPVSGLTLGDYDEDGDLDFFAVGGNSNTPTANGYRGLFQNDLSNGNHWVQFDLTGRLPSNTAAIGARVWVKAHIGGTDRWLQREISAQNTFMGHNALRVHVGLAQTSVIDSVKINWPSGDTDYLLNLAVDSIYSITQSNVGSGLHELFKIDSALALRMYPNPTRAVCEIQLPEGLNLKGGSLQVLDFQGKMIFQESVKRANHRLDVSELPTGIYLLHWQVDGKTFFGKMVVE